MGTETVTVTVVSDRFGGEWSTVATLELFRDCPAEAQVMRWLQSDLPVGLENGEEMDEMLVESE
jgi:hypothetical protein